MKAAVFSAIGILALSGCYGEPLTFEPTPLAVERWYDATFQDQPFDVGPVSVVTEEHGEMRTYLLTPCRNNTRICGSGVGTLSVTPDFKIITGAYPGRTFYLSGGGDGYLIRHGQTKPLAWNE